jgi:hypothetical protein
VKKASVRKPEIRIEQADAFFKRGRKLARLADEGKPIPPTKIVAFDSFESLLQVLRKKR